MKVYPCLFIFCYRLKSTEWIFCKMVHVFRGRFKVTRGTRAHLANNATQQYENNSISKRSSEKKSLKKSIKTLIINLSKIVKYTVTKIRSIIQRFAI